MKRIDAIRSVYPDLDVEGRVVVTIMGAVAAELQGLGHRPNFFYLQHAMGLAPSIGLGIALCRPELSVPFQWAFASMNVFGVGRDAAYVVDRIAERVTAKRPSPAMGRRRPDATSAR